MRLSTLTIAVCCLTAGVVMPVYAQDTVAKPKHHARTPKPAIAVIQRAEATSAKQHKPVFVMFHASW